MIFNMMLLHVHLIIFLYFTIKIQLNPYAFILLEYMYLNPLNPVKAIVFLNTVKSIY